MSNSSYAEKNQKIIQLMNNYSDRTATYVCYLAFFDYETQECFIFKGVIFGEIALNVHEGHNGFGYDPIFYLSSLNKTFSECTMSEKSQYSHRTNALKEFKN